MQLYKKAKEIRSYHLDRDYLFVHKHGVVESDFGMDNTQDLIGKGFEFYNKKADDDVFSRNYFYFKPGRKIYPFAIAYISRNYRRKITSRYFAGAGVTWQVLNRQSQVIKFSAGTVYEHSSFNGSEFNYAEYNGSRNVHLWRGTLYAGGWHFILKNHVKIYYDAFWQPSFQKSNNYRTQADIGLDIPVWKGLSVTALYTYTHENVVVKNIIQNDKIFTWGLSYNFRKD